MLTTVKACGVTVSASYSSPTGCIVTATCVTQRNPQWSISVKPTELCGVVCLRNPSSVNLRKKGEIYISQFHSHPHPLLSGLFSSEPTQTLVGEVGPFYSQSIEILHVQKQTNKQIRRDENGSQERWTHATKMRGNRFSQCLILEIRGEPPLRR